MAHIPAKTIGLKGDIAFISNHFLLSFALGPFCLFCFLTLAISLKTPFKDDLLTSTLSLSIFSWKVFKDLSLVSSSSVCKRL